MALNVAAGSFASGEFGWLLCVMTGSTLSVVVPAKSGTHNHHRESGSGSRLRGDDSRVCRTNCGKPLVRRTRFREDGKRDNR